MPYYSEKLSAERLKRCYDLAPPAVVRYLRAETDHVRSCLTPGMRILELGCGYGRAMKEIAGADWQVVGIDLSIDSLLLGRRYLEGAKNVALARMNAVDPAFQPGSFDLVLGIQNGLSAFGVDAKALLRAAAGVAKPGGTLLFSSYAAEFWEDRLHWFRLQAEEGLLGEIDEAATGNGAIACRDGFRATTFGPDDFLGLARDCGFEAEVTTVGGSSLFCEMIVPVSEA
jgi:SAM-dependent methyltransferase